MSTVEDGGTHILLKRTEQKKHSLIRDDDVTMLIIAKLNGSLN
jgi:hypothetical protein